MAATKTLFCGLAWESLVQRVKKHLRDAEFIQCDVSDVRRHLNEVEVVIPTMVKLTSELMDQAPKLKLIQQAGVGLEGVDIPAATERGIMVANVPSVVNRSDASVSELAVIHMMVLARRYNEAVSALRAGEWGIPEGTLLLGKTAGIIGMGNIGRALARRLRGFEMRLMGIDVPEAVNNPDFREKAGVDWLGDASKLDQLLAESDFVCLCASLSESARGLIGREQLAQMKPSAFLVNVARGPMVDPEALEDALKEQRIAGYGTDVFFEEPANPASSLFKYNVSPTPHVGATTDIAFDGIGRAVAANVSKVHAGEMAANCANGAELERRGNRRK